MTKEFLPPARFAEVSFDSYAPQTPSQETALKEARELTARIHYRHTRPTWRRWIARERDRDLRSGLYLVGPVGTGKTHLLVSMYHELDPEVPTAFAHSSRIFRTSVHPEAYAAMIAERFRVLLIDEVELDDPANEIRLIIILKELERFGVTVAATSNAEPEKFVSAQFGRERLERFISEQFRRTYHVVFVGGEDFRVRLDKPGKAWIGTLATANAAMRAHFDGAPGTKRWIDYDELIALTIKTERSRLTDELTSYDRLYLAGLHADNSDDAIRLLRVIDDLYTHDRSPALFYTAERRPDEWWTTADAEDDLEAGIAEKFVRTVSRLNALCAVERVGHGNFQEAV